MSGSPAPVLAVDIEKTVGAFRLAIAFRSKAKLTALFGRSGAGKSVTLALIAGLQRPDRGHIAVADRVLVDTARGIFLPPYRRRIGLVFQDSHLLPHLNVSSNLLFGRKFAPRTAARIEFDAVVATLGLEKLLLRRPSTLSGGERQRVAIGRALLSDPSILLLDEPFAALDAARKHEILPLVERVRDEFAVPIVFVSHALEEVTRLAGHVVLIRDGTVAAMGAPASVFGPSATVPGETRDERCSILTMKVGLADNAYGLTALEHPAGSVSILAPSLPQGTDVQILVKATDVVLTTSPNATSGLSIQGHLAGSVRQIEDQGPFAIVEIELNERGRLFAAVTRRAVDALTLAAGAPVVALIKTAALNEHAVGKAAFDEPGAA